MEAIAIVSALTGLQVFWFAWQVGVQRQKHGVGAPAVSGHADFERAFRVHQNTIEQLVIFVPAMWTFGFFVHELGAAGLGVVFLIGRFVYRSAYMQDPKSRSAGFGITALAMMAAVLGSIIGAAISLMN